MVCYSPKKAWLVGINPETGNNKYFITDYSVDHLYINKYGQIDCKYSEVSKYELPSCVIDEYMEVPCNKCVGCQLEYSKQWANRCMLELQYHDVAHFVTLTYDDKHLPSSDYIDVNGEYQRGYSLVKRDFQLFMKRLRKAFPDDKIRYFACGEYGSQSLRPHYHAIIYGLHLDDLKFYKSTFNGDILYTSPRLEEIWGNGFCPVGEVTFESCAYVSRYVMKKRAGRNDKFWEFHNLEPEFTLMSRKPGIGRQYFDDHKDEIYEYEFINIPTEKGGKKIRPPRYYDRVYAQLDPEGMQKIKNKRRTYAEAAREIKLSKTDLDYEDYLKMCLDKRMEAVKKLPRKEI